MVVRDRVIGSDVLRRKDENARLLRDDIAAGSRVFRGLPEIVSLYTTDICNLRCVMCPRSVTPGRHRLPLDVLERVCDELFPTARKAILTAAGGEPLLIDFDPVLERALRHEVKLDVITNGTSLTTNLYRRARPAFDHLNISVDCHIPDVYEKIRAGGRFAVVDANLRALAELRAREPDDVIVSVSAVLMRSNIPHISGFVEYAREIGADAVLLQRLRHDVKPTPDEDPGPWPGSPAIERCFDEARATATKVGMNFFLGEFGAASVVPRPLRLKVPETIEGRGLCWFVAQNFGVQYTGDVYPCCFPTDHLLGNVLDQGAREIWNGAPAQRLRAAHFSRRGTVFCSGCVHAPHLPERPSRRATQLLRRCRMRLRHERNRIARWMRRG